MPAGYTDAALEIGASAMVNRTFLIELHTADPGNPVANTPPTRTTAAGKITNGHNNYYPKWVAKGGFDAEGSSATEARYSNSADVEYRNADNGEDENGWGSVEWITIWYDADDADAADPGTGNSAAFDTLFSVMQLQTAQTVGNGDPFVIRARTIDLISSNAA